MVDDDIRWEYRRPVGYSAPKVELCALCIITATKDETSVTRVHGKFVCANCRKFIHGIYEEEQEKEQQVLIF